MIAIIYNPHSGGFSLDVLNQLQELLKSRGYDVCPLPTEYAGHATELAAGQSADKCEAIISYGGDGTTNEVLNGMAASGIPLLLCPSGTGNDMVRTLGIPRDPIQALNVQLNAPLRRMDAIQVNDRWYMNVAGLGLDVTVLLEYERLRSRMFGSFAYKLAILLTLAKFRSGKIRLKIGDQPQKLIEYCFLSFGNGKYFGGGMKCMPDADPFDGIIDIMHVTPLSKLFILSILPLFFAGKHTKLKPVHNYRAKHLSIDSDEPFWMQLDGELYQTSHADIRIRPGILNLRLPE